ncbi:glutathione hydrolase 1 proenzyme-like isoform X2 [Dermacentor albipictus]|uniref:glutathione hydrolase 1 proenzyme-like isoform X2 n=1 Tax=Dermacentor albipictus TaxID=60249 RepID=UPI0038FCE998
MASFWGHVRVTLTWLLPVSLAAVMVVLVVLYAIREVPRVERQPRFISTSPMGVYHTWAAITGAEYCAGTPRRILEMNGTIADVTVASQLCQSVMNPHQCGLGGGFISVYYNHATRKAKAFNAREWAPSAAWSNMFLANSTLSSYAVPGELMGYRSMLDSIGSRVPWAELFKDAEALARNGFPVYADLERLLKQNEKVITADEALCEVFCSRLYPQNKTTMVINETLRMPALADTLATIAREGHQAFYGGSVGKMLSDDIRRKGGLITLQDLRSYTVKVDDALRRVLHDNVTVLAPPPPAGGILTAFMLAVMDSYRNPEAPTVKSLPDNDETFHRLVEVTKFAFAGRMEIGDPEHIDISAVVKNISSSSFLSEVRSRIKQYPVSDYRYYGLRFQGRESHSSCQFVVIMPDGDALAQMSSLNRDFGALAISASTGVLLNNEMDDFANPGKANTFGLVSSATNYIRPKKRPTSSMSPLVITDADGSVVMATSSTGAFFICSGLTQVVMRSLWMNHTVKEAIDAPRIHHQLPAPEVLAEEQIDQDVLQGLLNRKHQVKFFKWYGEAIALLRRPGDNRIYGSYDYRFQITGGMDGD